MGDYDKRTAIHLAASEGHIQMVLYLIEAGVDPNPKDRWGGTPLDDANREGHTELAKLLRDKGAYTGEEIVERVRFAC